MERACSGEKKNRPLSTLIAELQEAVIAAGNRLRSSDLAAQTGASASRSAEPAEPPLASRSSSSVEQPAATTTGTESTAKRPLETATVAQPSRRAKAPRKGILSASASATLRETLHTRDEGPEDVRCLPHPHEDTSAAQPGLKSKQRRLTAMFTAADSQHAGAAASAAAAAAAAASSTAAENQPARAASSSSTLASPTQSSQRSIFEYGSTPDEFAQLRRTMTCMVQELTRLKPHTAADVDTTEALATLVKQAKQLRQYLPPI